MARITPHQSTPHRHDTGIDLPQVDDPGGAHRIIDVRSLDLGGDIVLVTDAAGTIVDVNDAFVRVTGYSRREAIGQSPRLLSSGYQDEAFYRELWGTVTRGEVWEGELVDRRRDGALRTYHATISPVRDPTGRITHFVAVERDVTRDLARQASLGSTGLIHTDRTGRCVYADVRAAALLGGSPTELLGRGLAQRLEPEDAEQLAEAVSMAAETGRVHRLDVRPRDGGTWLHIELSPLTVPSGTVIGAAGAIEDLSEQLAVHRELERRDALLTSVLDALADPIAVVADDGTILAVNVAWRRARCDEDDEVLAAGVGEDLEAGARSAADRGDAAAATLLTDLHQVRTTGTIHGPTGREPTDRRYGLTPLAWEEGGYVLRRLG